MTIETLLRELEELRRNVVVDQDPETGTGSYGSEFDYGYSDGLRDATQVVENYLPESAAAMRDSAELIKIVVMLLYPPSRKALSEARDKAEALLRRLDAARAKEEPRDG